MSAPLPVPAAVAAEGDPVCSRIRVAVHHVGCKLNHYEAEALRSGFDGRGFQVVSFDSPADVYVVNTCTVTGSGDADSRRAVRRARLRNADALVVATGCYAQRCPEDLRAAGAGLVVGNAHKAGLVEAVAARLGGRDLPDVEPGDRPRTLRFLGIDGAVAGGRTRGTLQIQDGCDEHCTYCIIPAVRGPGVSRPVDDVVEQARNMVGSGYRELALTGVHSGSYGHDLGRPQALVELLRRLEEVQGLERIRLNSVEPGCLSDQLIDFAATSGRFCRHFHVPLQSGDDRILRRMGRRYTAGEYAGRIQRIAARIPDCAIGADVMVGFPGEGDEGFESTFHLVESLPLTYLHVFAFSPRPGTPALRLADRPAPVSRSERAGRLIELSRAKRLAFHRRHLGRDLAVLVEAQGEPEGGLASGLTDNYIRVLLAAPGAVSNRLVTARAVSAREDVVFGEVAA